MAKYEPIPDPADIDSTLLPLAAESCAWCRGYGVVVRSQRGPRACECVWREICRAVRRFCRTVDRYPAEPLRGPTAYSRPGEEYLADVELAARCVARRRYEALDMEWPDASKHTGLSRELWFHERYRIMARLGRAFYERGMYPLERYFAQRVVPAQPAVRPNDKSQSVLLTRVSSLTFMSWRRQSAA